VHPQGLCQRGERRTRRCEPDHGGTLDRRCDRLKPAPPAAEGRSAIARWSDLGEAASCSKPTSPALSPQPRVGYRRRILPEFRRLPQVSGDAMSAPSQPSAPEAVHVPNVRPPPASCGPGPEHRLHRAADHRGRPRRPGPPELGRHGLHPVLDGRRAALRQARGPLRSAQHRGRLGGALPRGVGALRPGHQHDLPDPVPRAAGPRRRRPVRPGPVGHRRRDPAAGRSGPADGGSGTRSSGGAL
jgi:hypothetical protein